MAAVSSPTKNQEDFSKCYNLLAKKYSLPTFEALNADFEIEKVSPESIAVLRAVRKAMIEKVFNVLNFLEMLLNPANAPRIYLSYIKSMPAEDRHLIDLAYSHLGDVALRALPREVDYSEKEEALMIKAICHAWGQAKLPLRTIMHHLTQPQVNNTKKEKTYFG